MTPKLIFCNSETLQWKNENKKAELNNSKILLDEKLPSFLTRVFLLSFFFFNFKISELCNSEVLFWLNASAKSYRPSRTFFWTKMVQKIKASIIYKISRMLSANINISLAHFTNFSLAHFEIQESFWLICAKLQNGRFHLQIFISDI